MTTVCDRDTGASLKGLTRLNLNLKTKDSIDNNELKTIKNVEINEFSQSQNSQNIGIT